MDSDRRNVFRPNLAALLLCGLWSFSPAVGWRYRLYSGTVISLFVSLLVSGLLGIFTVDDMANVASTLSISFTNISNGIKMLPFLFQSARLRALIDDLEGHLYPQGTRDHGKEKEALIGKVERSGLVRQVLYTGLLLVTTSVACYRPVLQEEELRSSSNVTSTARKLPFDAWWPFSRQLSPNYEIIYFLQVISSLIDAMQSASKDLFYLALIAHTSVLFQLLKVSLKKVHETAARRLANGKEEDLDDDDGENLPLDRGTEMGKEMECCLNECIPYHQDILRYAEEVRKLLRPLMLVECVNITVILCMILYHATSLSTSQDKLSPKSVSGWRETPFDDMADQSQLPLMSVAFLNILSFYMCEMLQLLQYCWFGSSLLWE